MSQKKSDSVSTRSSSEAKTAALISGLRIAQVIPQKTTEKSLADLKPGDHFDAEAQVLFIKKGHQLMLVAFFVLSVVLLFNAATGIETSTVNAIDTSLFSRC